MRIFAAVSSGSDESKTSILCTLEWSPTQFVLQCDQWFYDQLKIFCHYLLLLELTFGWARFCLALHLEWFLNRSIDKNQMQFEYLQTCVLP